MRRLVQDIENTHQQERSKNDQNGNYLRNQKEPGPRRRSIKSKALPPLSTSRTFHHQTGFGFVRQPYFALRENELNINQVPTPWETKLARSFCSRVVDRLTSELKPESHDYLSFKPRLDSRGRFLELSEHDRLELGGVEYRALQALLMILIGYQVFWYAIGTLFLVPYAYRAPTRAILHDSQPDLNRKYLS